MGLLVFQRKEGPSANMSHYGVHVNEGIYLMFS